MGDDRPKQGTVTEPRAWVLIVVAGLLGVLSPLGAQSQRQSTTAPCAFDTASHSATLVKQLGVVAYRNRDTVPDRALTAAFGAVIQPNFVPPPTIGMLAYPGTVPAPRIKSIPMTQSLLGVLHLRVPRNGVPRELSWEVITYDPSTEAEIVRLLTDASATTDLQAIGAAVDSGEVRLHLVWLPDSSNIVSLLRMRVTEILIEEPVKYLDGPLPSYPVTLRAQGIEGRVVMRYVVGENGKPVAGTIRVIAASRQEFINAAIDAVSKSRFQPARTAGCSVPTLLEHVVRFTIGRGQ